MIRQRYSVQCDCQGVDGKGKSQCNHRYEVDAVDRMDLDRRLRESGWFVDGNRCFSRSHWPQND